MARLQGAGSHKDVSVLFEIMGQNEKGAFVNVQVDQSLKNPDKIREGKSQADSNPYLVSREVDHPNGGKYVDHTLFYQNSQIEKMKEGAKATVKPDGKALYGAKVTVFPQKGESGKANFSRMVIDTKKPIEPTANPRFGKTTWDKQMAVNEAAKAYAKEKRAERTKSIQAEAENQGAEVAAPEMENDQPAV